MSDPDDARSTRRTARHDGGRDDDGTNDLGDDGTNNLGDDGRDGVRDDIGGSKRRGGFFSRLFPGRDPMVRSLRRQLRQRDEERQDLREQIQGLQSRIDELEREKAALEETKASYEQRQFGMNALLRSVGRSFDQASDDLADLGVTVGDLDITLHADVSGGGQQETLDLRLVDPDEEIDPDRLSTISFSVGRRGRLRHYGHPGAQPSGGGSVGPLGAVPGTDEPDSGDDVADTDGTTSRAPPVEVPNVNGLSAEAATEELTDAGFEVHTEYRSDETPADRVVEQWPRAFAVAPRGSSVVLFVGGEQGETE